MCRALEGVWFVCLHDQVGIQGVVSSHPGIRTFAKMFGEVCRPPVIWAALGLLPDGRDGGAFGGGLRLSLAIPRAIAETTLI